MDYKTADLKDLIGDIDLPGNPADIRVVVAMSGGVDSSVAAAVMNELGFDTVGITLQLYDHGEAIAKKGACCAGQDIHDARRVADQIGIPHYVLDYENKFRETVIDDFVDTYLEGATPIPCVRCNQRVKFRDLLETAKDLGAAAMVTGHYVKRSKVEGQKSRLERGADHSRDQSYFLFATTQEQLDFLRFPLGGLTKDVTRQLAERYDLAVADKPDSQDICFVPNGSYAGVIEKLRPGAIESGKIVDLDGNELGDHNGIIHYTVGQRRGLGIAAPDPLYVIRVDAEKHEVVVGPKSALLCPELTINELNWIGDQDLDTAPVKIAVKIRSMSKPMAATLEKLNDRRARIIFDEDQSGIAPGQACVFYEDERVLGGGWIEKRVLNADKQAA